MKLDIITVVLLMLSIIILALCIAISFNTVNYRCQQNAKEILNLRGQYSAIAYQQEEIENDLSIVTKMLHVERAKRPTK